MQYAGFIILLLLNANRRFVMGLFFRTENEELRESVRESRNACELELEIRDAKPPQSRVRNHFWQKLWLCPFSAPRSTWQSDHCHHQI